MLQVPLKVGAATGKGQICNIITLILPVLDRDGVEGGILGCEDKAWLRSHVLVPGKFHCVEGWGKRLEGKGVEEVKGRRNENLCASPEYVGI